MSEISDETVGTLPRCTCPLIDTSAPGGPPEFVLGDPAGCKVHGQARDAEIERGDGLSNAVGEALAKVYEAAYRAGREDAAREVMAAADDPDHGADDEALAAAYGKANEIAQGAHNTERGSE